MEDLKNPDYVMLEKEFYNLHEELKKEEKILKGKIFEKANKKLRIYEKEIEEEFLEIWKKYGDPEYIFDNFKMHLDPITNHNYISVMTLTTPTGILDLESIALECSEEKREDNDSLESYSDNYKKTRENMKEIFRKFKLYLRWSDALQIREFQERFNILTFEPRYFESKRDEVINKST